MKWYKHDSDAHSDAKLRRVRIKYGLEGYGLYWYCLELIAANVEAHNLTFELEHDSELIAHDTGIHYERVEEMMMFMVDLGLFERQQGIITCRQMLKRLDQSMTSNPQMRKMIDKAKQNHDSVMTHPDSVMTKSGTIMQEEKRTEEKRREQKVSLPDGLNKQAWSDYLEHRKELGKKALTPKGQTMAANKLACLPAKQQQDVVNLSIENGWTGLFPDKFKPRQDAKSDELRSRVRLVE